MSLEDRLQLMNIMKEGSPARSSPDRSPENAAKAEAFQNARDLADAAGQDNFAVPRISRESILRRVKSRNFDEDEEQQDEFASAPSSPERNYDNVDELDPDVPIASREASSNFEFDVPEVSVKQEPNDDDFVDVYSIPDLYSVDRSLSPQFNLDRDGSVVRHDVGHVRESAEEDDDDDDDDASRYSPDEVQQTSSNSTTEDEGPPTPKQEDVVIPSIEEPKEEPTSLPQVSLFDDDFSRGLASYMSDSPPDEKTPESHPTLESLPRPMFRPETPQSLSQVPWEDDQRSIEEPGTPDSVIRHPIEHTWEATPEIPEVEATIRAPGSGLKTRSSVSRREIEAINDDDEPPLPIPARDLGRRLSTEPRARRSSSDSRPKSSESRPKSTDLNMEAMKLDLLVPEVGGLGLDAEFDRVIEAQKVASLSFTSPAFTSSAHFPPSSAEHVDGTAFSPHNKRLSANQTYRTQKGYLMRHNTKVVVARSGRDFSDEVKTKVGNGTTSDAGQASVMRDGTKSANSSPRKASESKPYQTMPWDSKARRKSIRTASGEVRKRAKEGPAPPLPGMESAVNGLGALEEANGDGEWEEGTERGRLFVKVIGVKDLDLPLPKNERTDFQLTLDNGLHCVTTSWLELGRSAPVGQEFELVVLNDLEFQLTLQTKLTPPPKPVAGPAPSPTKAPASPTKGSVSKSRGFFASLAMSPKKRREQERLLKEEAERQAQQEARENQRRQQEEASRRQQQQQRNAGPATAWDLLHTLVGGDGSFARAYISLKSHERSCFGRPFVVDIPCYNEWALEDNDRIVSSVKSKQRGHGPVRRPPYEVGKLQLQLLYVPKPKGTREEEMPKSMNAAVREMREAEEVKERSWEGFLSQQGGDCPVSSSLSSFVSSSSSFSVPQDCLFFLV